MPRSAIIISSRTTISSASGPTPRASSTISPSPATTRRNARSATAPRRSSASSTRRMPCATTASTAITAAIPISATSGGALAQAESRRKLGLPEENLLYFIEKRAPKLDGWQRELVRIVRNISQYFYPQKQTQLMNEGCATFVHYEIMNRLHEKGQITEGAMLEFLHSHSSVVFQPAFDDPRYSGITPSPPASPSRRTPTRISVAPR